MIVFTDGAAEPTNPGPAGWGWWVRDDLCDYGSLGVVTNNVAELTAIRQALTTLPTDVDIELRPDSQYAINSIGFGANWLAGWRRRGWVTSKGSPVANRELITDIVQLIAVRTAETTCRWVRGHVGVLGNERADQLAGRGAAESRQD